MSLFSDVWAGAGEGLDDAFGEMFIVAPRKTGPYTGSAPDPDRQPFAAMGILDQRPLTVRNEGKGKFEAQNPDRMSSVVTIDFALSAFPGGRDDWPKAGDRVTASDRPDLPAFEVVSADPSGQGRVTFNVLPVKP